LEELSLFPTERINGTKLLLAYFDEKGFDYGLSVLGSFRKALIKTEIFPEVAKIKKQLEFAVKKEIPYVGICGDNEIDTGTISVKNLSTGEQESMSIEAALAFLG
jgi:histidyl-tRNA synthetase